jgi:F1F0 ATPase subunit 2
MGELLYLAVPFAAGFALGAAFFGGLWWTVIHALSSKQPALWLLGSKLLRMGVAVLGFFLICGGRWERWLICLLGFVLARLVTWCVTHASMQSRADQTPHTRDAP